MVWSQTYNGNEANSHDLPLIGDVRYAKYMAKGSKQTETKLRTTGLCPSVAQMTNRDPIEIVAPILIIAFQMVPSASICGQMNCPSFIKIATPVVASKR